MRWALAKKSSGILERGQGDGSGQILAGLLDVTLPEVKQTKVLQTEYAQAKVLGRHEEPLEIRDRRATILFEQAFGVLKQPPLCIDNVFVRHVASVWILYVRCCPRTNRPKLIDSRIQVLRERARFVDCRLW